MLLYMWDFLGTVWWLMEGHGLSGKECTTYPTSMWYTYVKSAG